MGRQEHKLVVVIWLQEATLGAMVLSKLSAMIGIKNGSEILTKTLVLV